MEKGQLESVSGTQVYNRRWAMLAMFVLLSASNAFQWIEYAIITDVVSHFYGVSTIWVNWTSMIYMLNYIPLILPATWLLDRYGLKVVVLLGAAGNCIGAVIKCFSASPDLFWLSFIGQTIAGSSQIFVLGVPPRLAAVWFGPKQVSTACAMGVFGNQAGIALGFLLPPELVEGGVGSNVTIEDTGRQLMYLFTASAAVNSMALVLIALFFSAAPPMPPSLAQMKSIDAGKEKNYGQSLLQLLRNRNYLLLLITYGINVGVFYAVSTLLNQTVLKYYVGAQVHVGRIGLLIVFAGMIGSAVAGVWLDITHTFKLTTLVIYVFSFVGMLLYTLTVDLGHLWLVYVVAGLLGFFMTGYLPIGFEFGAELTFPAAEGTQSGLLNASAQIFGVTLTWSMGEVLERVSVFTANTTLTAVLFLGLVITAFIKSDLRRQNASKSDYHQVDTEATLTTINPAEQSTTFLLGNTPMPIDHDS